MSSLFKRPAATAQKRPAASTSSGRPSKKPAATWEVPPQAAAPVIHVMHNGKRHRLHGDCKNYSRVRQSVCKKFHLETVALEYEDDDGWVVFDDEVDKDGGLQARAKWSLRVCGEESAAEKIRVDGFCEAVEARAVLASIDDLKRALTEHQVVRPDLEYCAPRKMAPTYGFKEWGATLRKAYTDTEPSTVSRSPRVAALVLGTGFGKTHALLEAAAAWKPEPECTPRQIFITYNLDQALTWDKSNYARAAFLLRVLLTTMGRSNLASDTTLDILDSKTVSSLHSHWLLPAVAAEVKMWLGDCRHLVLAVDECMQLATANSPDALKPVKDVVSELGALSECLRLQGIKCLALVSSLQEEPFRTPSGRSVCNIALPSPSLRDLAKWATTTKNKNLTSTNIDELVLLAGSHWRSVSTAIDKLNRMEVLGVPGFWGQMGTDYLTKMSTLHRSSVRLYIVEEYSRGREMALANHPEAQIYINNEGSIPPTLAFALFRGSGKFTPICDFFTNSLHVDATKQLECCGVDFDRFKAQQGLPLLGAGIIVRLPSDYPRGAEWFQALTLSTEAAQPPCTQPWFGRISGSVQLCRELDDISPTHTYHPAGKTHPWIDRVAVALSSPTHEKCIVLYQDKTDKNLTEALESLSKAAREIRKKCTMDILCVAQVLQDSTEPCDLPKYPFPLVVINQVSLKNWYRATFVGAVEYQLVRRAGSRINAAEDSGRQNPPNKAALQGYQQD